MNIKLKLAFAIVIALTLIPSSLLCIKYIQIVENVSSIEVASDLGEFANKIESGEYAYSAKDMVSRFRKMANSVRMIDSGFSKIGDSFRIWLGLVVFCTLANAYFLRVIYVGLRERA